MPVYKYEGRREKTGELVRGLREAPTHAGLGQDLLSEGILLTSYTEKVQKLAGITLLAVMFKHVPIIERALFARYFALMLRSGLDVKRSIGVLSKQTRSKALREALESVYHDVERGKTLAVSMRSFPHAFTPLFVSFIKVGEATGRLQESLEVLAAQLQKEYELNRAVRGGLLYPVVIILAMITVGVAMMFLVVPKLVEVFEGFDVELPLPTRMLIGLSEIFQVYWLLLIIGGVGILGASWGLMRIPVVKAAVMSGLMRTPVIGKIMQKVNLARFARNLGSLLKSGVSFVNALDILGSSAPHPSYAQAFLAAREHVRQGKELSLFLEGLPRLFPITVVSVVKVGEETGELDDVLAEIALFYESEVDQTMKNLTSVMEPVLMIIVGLAVGALAVSVISPIYDLVNVI